MYEPSEDSFLIKKRIKDYAKGNVLDMGTGSGILAIEAAKFAEHVVACDIDADLIKNLKNRFKKEYSRKIKFQFSFPPISEGKEKIVAKKTGKRCKIQFVHSDLFDCFKKNSNLKNKNLINKFDLIIFNPPYLPEDKREPVGWGKVATTFEPGVFEKFLATSKKFLKKGGKILMLLSSLTPRIAMTLIKSLYRVRFLDQRKIAWETLYVMELT